MHQRRRLSLWCFVPAALLAIGCAEPLIVEDSALACSNGRDDDGDADADCEDADCAGSGACEVAMEACRNGLDDDENGLADCEDARCLAGGFCSPIQVDCSLVPQGGCPKGMGCFLVDGDLVEGVTECRVPGEGTVKTECAFPESAEPSECAAGFQCAGSGACAKLCQWDGDCERETLCLRGTFPVGFCSLPCIPISTFSTCTAEMSCFSFHRYGTRYEAGGALWGCFPPPAPFDAMAAEDEACDDLPNIAAPHRICKSPYACVPDAAGEHRCRTTCLIGAASEEPVDSLCPAGKECVTLYPLDPRPAPPFLLGACLAP